MAKEIQRRVNIALRSVAVDVQDIFGNVTTHTIPLFGDPCPTCGMALPGGTKDLNASAQTIVDHVTEIETALAEKLQTAGIATPQV
jgi:hypothetical protein